MKKILTLFVDGLGFSENTIGNAYSMAKTPTFDKVFYEYPSCELAASGEEVGLSENQPGNSVVGYETITSGEIIKQKSLHASDFTDIDNLATNTPIKNMLENIKNSNGTIHIAGVMSDGGVMSNIQDTLNLIEFLKTQNIRMVVDFISDGKDVDYKSAMNYIKQIEETGVPIATICGRYYALDKNEKWDRTKIYYDLIKNGVGSKVKEIEIALKNCYMRNITDEFIPPIVLQEDANLKNGDALIWMNYESEESKQILTAITNPSKAPDFKDLPLINLKTLMLYPVDPQINGTVLIHEDNNPEYSMGEYLSKLELSQARIADSEYYDYVTYHFNGKSNKKITNCINYEIDLPKDTEDRDKRILDNITKQIIKCMEKDTDFIVASLSKVDEIGHTGDFAKTVDMIEYTDACLNKIMAGAENNFYKVIILSTHGNVEEMLSEENKTKKINTCNSVPFLITDKTIELMRGTLVNVAPTILSYMDLAIPESMKGVKVLIKE